jgi:catechol 2,3-dioxygenase-like lactoylglutathione lyase family enzyme
VLDHRSIQYADLSASARFYDAALGPLGGVRVMEFGDAIGYGRGGKPWFWLGPLTTGEPNREVHVGFAAPDRAAVRAFFQAAVATGAPPRVWPEYHPTYYGAFVRDPDGNNVEAVYHSPEHMWGPANFPLGTRPVFRDRRTCHSNTLLGTSQASPTAGRWATQDSNL